ncbi:MAG: Plug domain-containing protein [Nitrosomonas sp.]
MAQNMPLKQDISDASLAELMSTKISTVSRKPQTLSDTPAAVFVISQEDIRRASANSIPELLRMAPGLSVARIDANKWSVTSRGYSGRFADDLLVMIDGRTVYSPLFAGTFWETLDLPLEDIERIEVIRGPGGANDSWRMGTAGFRADWDINDSNAVTFQGQ